LIVEILNNLERINLFIKFLSLIFILIIHLIIFLKRELLRHLVLIIFNFLLLFLNFIFLSLSLGIVYIRLCQLIFFLLFVFLWLCIPFRFTLLCRLFRFFLIYEFFNSSIILLFSFLFLILILIYIEHGNKRLIYLELTRNWILFCHILYFWLIFLILKILFFLIILVFKWKRRLVFLKTLLNILFIRANFFNWPHLFFSFVFIFLFEVLFDLIISYKSFLCDILYMFWFIKICCNMNSCVEFRFCLKGIVSF